MLRTHQANHVQGRIRNLICMLALVVAVMVCTTRAEAFCVYNKSDIPIEVKQTKGYSSWGKRATWVIGPGQNRCCNYKNKDCNKSQEKTAKVEFRVFYQVASRPLVMCKKELKAGGWLTIKEKGDGFSCKAHY